MRDGELPPQQKVHLDLEEEEEVRDIFGGRTGGGATKPVTKPTEAGGKPVTKPNETGNKPGTNPTETGNKPGTKPTGRGSDSDHHHHGHDC